MCCVKTLADCQQPAAMDSCETKQLKRKIKQVSDVKESCEKKRGRVAKRTKKDAQEGIENEEGCLGNGSRKEEKKPKEGAEVIRKRHEGGEQGGYAATREGGLEWLEGSLSTPKVVHALRNPKLSMDRKIELAFDFTLAYEKQQHDSGDDKDEWIAIPQFVSFLSDWLQSAIIKSSKESCMAKKPLGGRLDKERTPASLNAKCWTTLHWCLRSGHLQGVNSVSPSLLKGVTFVLPRFATEELDIGRTGDSEAEFGTCGKGLAEALVDVLHVLLTEYERSFRPNLDQWFSLALAALNLAQVKGLTTAVSLNDDVGPLHLLVLVVMEGFARFITWYPYPRTVFEAMVEKLLPSVLLALERLSWQKSDVPQHQNQQFFIWHTQYLKALQNLVREGLFQASHVGELAETCIFLASLEDLHDAELLGPDGEKTSTLKISAYQKHLFEKLEQMRRDRNPVALDTRGFMLRAYAKKLKSQSSVAFQDFFGRQAKDTVQDPQNHTGSEHTIPDDTDEAGPEGQSNATKDTASVILNQQRKALSQSEKLFVVFAEFTGPLMKEFGQLFQECDLRNPDSVVRIIPRATYLATAVNSLLSAAIDHHVYIPTEDTPTEAHLGFLRFLQDTIMKAAGLLAAIAVDNEGSQVLPSSAAAPLMKQIVLACGHLLGLESRVTEAHLAGIWLILFITVALGHTEGNDRENTKVYEALPEVIEVACQIIRTYSDLRQVDHAIGVLCSCLRNIMTSGISDIKRKVTCDLDKSWCLPLSKVVQAVVASRTFLHTVALVVKKLPEGQTAEVLRVLAADLVETLELLNKFDESSYNEDGATNALSEIYAHVFENVNVTTTNSILVGASIRRAGPGISGPLAVLIDVALRAIRYGFCDKDASGLRKTGHKKGARSRIIGEMMKAPNALEWHEDSCHLKPSRICFSFRIFLAYRSLDRQCRSLMPPKAARKANAEIGEPSLDLLRMSCKEISSSLLGRKLFSCIGRGTEHLPDILRGIEGISEQVSDKYPALAYLLDCLAVQRVVELRKYLRILEFLPSRFEQEEGTASGKNHLDDLVEVADTLKQEISYLVAFVCRGLASLRQSMDHLSGNISIDDQVSGTPESSPDVQQRTWDMIVSTLERETLPVARWRLLCLTVDVWSDHAADSSLEDFLACMLGSCHYHSSRRPNAEIIDGATNHQTTMDLTESLIRDSRFFEQHQLRKVFTSVFWRNLKTYLPAVFRVQQAREKSAKDDEIDLAQIVGRIKGELETNGKHTSFISQRVTLAEEAPKSQKRALRMLRKLVIGTNFDSTVQALENCAGLLDQLSQFPRGYFTDSDIAEHASHLAEVERYLVHALLNIRDAVLLKKKEFVVLASGTNLQKIVLLLLQVLSNCRGALKSLAFPRSDTGRAVMCTLFESEYSATWLTFSIYAAAAVLSDLGRLWQGPEAIESFLMLNPLHALVGSTCHIISYISGDIFNEEARSLLITENAIPSPNRIPHQTESMYASEQSMPRLAHSLYEQIQVFELCFTSGDPSLPLQGNPQPVDGELLESGSKLENSVQRNWFGLYVVLSAVSSYLWSMVSSVESINQKCHDGDNHDMRWQAELPSSWLSSIQELEPILVKSLLSIVAPGNSQVLNISRQHFEGEKGGKPKEGLMLVESAEVHGTTHDDDQFSEARDDSMSDRDIVTNGNLFKSTSRKVVDISGEQSTQLPDFAAMTEVEAQIIQNIVGGVERHRSECVGQLFLGAAALLRLRSLCFSPAATGVASKTFVQFGQKDTSMPLWVRLVLRAAYWLLKGAVSSSDLVEISNKRWLLGVVQYMESVGGLMSCIPPSFPVSTYSKLIDLHMKLLGDLAPSRQELIQAGSGPHAVQLTTDGTPSEAAQGIVDRLEGDSENVEDVLAPLRNAIKNSFAMLLKDCPRQHFIVALQLAEKSVVDASVYGSGLTFNLDNGGRPVSAGIQSMAIFLKAITSKGRLRLLANHSPAFLSSIFNLLAKLQYLQLDNVPRGSTSEKDRTRLGAKSWADAAIIILQCLEILIMLASRPILFHMGANYISMGVHLPALLFRPFYEVRIPAHVLSQSYLPADQQREAQSARIGDHSKVLINLYANCCRLLCSLLRHRTREAGHCIALLAESVKVLLRCLGVPNWYGPCKQAGRGEFWNITDAKVCALWLRRVYEELGEQKATLGKYCAHILAEYLCVVSGVGPLASGLNREVESALRPGAFALVDACTPRDLQQLYTTLGDGPPRSALTSLKNDYERNFKYTGKV